MPYTDLKQELDRLTSRIWWDVTTVRAAQGPWKLGEVSVTERLHLDLLHSGLMDGMVKYEVPDEPTTGADWEWLVQVPGTQRFLRYRIQAKILAAVRRGSAAALRFPKIGYRNQRATLLNQARIDNALPFYAFYVGNPWPHAAPIDLPHWRHVAGIPDEHFGCTAVPADDVDQVHNLAVGSKSEATQYLTQGSGRRLSDLLPNANGGSPGSHPSGTGGGGTAPGSDNLPPDGLGPGVDDSSSEGAPLAPREAAWLAQLKEGAAGGKDVILTHKREDHLRATIFFSVR